MLDTVKIVMVRGSKNANNHRKNAESAVYQAHVHGKIRHRKSRALPGERLRHCTEKALFSIPPGETPVESTKHWILNARSGEPCGESRRRGLFFSCADSLAAGACPIAKPGIVENFNFMRRRAAAWGRNK